MVQKLAQKLKTRLWNNPKKHIHKEIQHRMKKIILTFAAGFMSTAMVMGQGSDRTNAIMAFKDFNKAIQELNLDKAEKSLKEAKDYIDKAYTAAPTDHKTLFYKGQIYSSMVLTLIDPSSFADMAKDPCSGKPKYKDGLDPKKAEADAEMYASEGAKALKEAMANPSKKDDFSDQIKATVTMQAFSSFNCGTKFYNDKKYAEAADAFHGSIEMKDIIGVADTLGYYNSALAYERLKDSEKEAAMWKKVVELKYGGADSYSGLANALNRSGKADEAAKAIQEGRAKYPKDQGLIISEVNYHLGKGDNAAAEKAINEAIALDNKNATLFFALGSVYDNLKQYDKAEASYKKAIEIDPKYFDALYNLGAMKYNEGAEILQKIKDIADDAEYNKGKNTADEKFKQAQPYIEKAREINPKDRDNLEMLKNIYVRMGDPRAAEINALLKGN